MANAGATSGETSTDWTFGGTWPFDPSFTEAPGYRTHYVDQGEGPGTLVLLHGEPTWSYLFRSQIAAWSCHHRVIAIDHMGFGRSETPADRTYWLQDHIDNLERVVLDLDLRGITLVMHDFGGPVGMGLASRHPERIARIVSINGPTPLGQDDLGAHLESNAAESPWFRWILRAERSGALDDVLAHVGFSMLSTLWLNGFEDRSIITPEWLAAYAAPFPTPAEALGAIGWAKGFATGQHAFEQPDASTSRHLRKLPALALWGDRDRTLHHKHFRPLFESAFPDGEFHLLPGAGHYSPEDSKKAVSERVLAFLKR